MVHGDRAGRLWRAARVMAAGAVLAAAVAMGGCESEVSDENFEKITVGMTLDQVQNFMGDGTQEVSGGSTISSSGVLGGTNNAQASGKTYVWKDGEAMIIVDFMDNKVVSKRKRGF